MPTDIGREITALKKRMSRMERASRLGSASLDDTALEVRSSGSLRALVGQQADGTTAVNIVNAGPPPAPSTPTAGPALGGIAVTWSGTYAGGVVMPLDWARVEVHASVTNGFTPSAATLQATIETPQGATVYIPTTATLYVVLLARNTSGTPSASSAQVGPYAPRAVVAGDVADGSITTTKIADNAVTTPKVLAGAIDTAQLAALAITTAKLAAGSVDATALNATAITGKTITGGVVTGSVVQTASTGKRIVMNQSGSNALDVYDSSNRRLMSVGGADSGSLIVYPTSGTKEPVSIDGGDLTWWDASGPIYTPDMQMYARPDNLYLMTQLGGGVRFKNGTWVRVLSDETDEPWHAPTMGTGWATGPGGAGAYPPLQWRRTLEGHIWVFGTFHPTSTTPSAPIASGFPNVDLTALGGVGVSAPAIKMAAVPTFIPGYINDTGQYRAAASPTFAVNDTFMLNSIIPLS